MTFDWRYALEVLPKLLSAAGTTVLATLGGMAVALVVGLLFALLLRVPSVVVRVPVQFVLEFVRGTPLLIQLFFLFYVLPVWGIKLDALGTGIVGLGLHYSTYVAEVYRAGIESIPKGQWEAATSLSLGPGRTWGRIILPQVVTTVLPMLANNLIAMLKDTPLLATITVIELLGAAMAAAAGSYRYLEVFTLIGVIFLALSYPAGVMVRRLERAMQLRKA